MTLGDKPNIENLVWTRAKRIENLLASGFSPEAAEQYIIYKDKNNIPKIKTSKERKEAENIARRQKERSTKFQEQSEEQKRRSYRY